MKIVFTAIIVSVFIAGCAGSLECNFVTTNLNSIRVEPTDAKTITIRCNECYWWVDDDGRLNIAGIGLSKSLINSMFDREFYISFVLDNPSKGVGKNYRLTHQSVRGLVKLGGTIYRFRSVYGILGSENRENNVIKAAYRVNIRMYVAKLLGGWSKAVTFIIYGSLEAVPDRANKGKKIREKTEQAGYSRALLPLEKDRSKSSSK